MHRSVSGRKTGPRNLTRKLISKIDIRILLSHYFHIIFNYMIKLDNRQLRLPGTTWAGGNSAGRALTSPSLSYVPANIERNIAPVIAIYLI